MHKNYKELIILQKSCQPCLDIYKVFARFPKEERFALTSQVRRASVENKPLNP
ncbi:MAG: four helix bundle protein [Deltaproteobacteria bacterium]|nr:four helix bundle protein [Deltaproteobacteria bacterium]